MSLVSVPAVYDGKRIRLLEHAPVQEAYHVLVTFVKPAFEARRTEDTGSFWASFGAWQDERPVEATLQDISQTRYSKVDPPTL